MATDKDTRCIRRRLIVRGILVLNTAARIGATDPLSLTDQSILKDHKGNPFIPGTTLAGLLRSHLHEALGGGAEEAADVAQILGCRWGNDDEPQSPLIVEDAPMIVTNHAGYITELRDGVKIDERTETAEKHKKFDMELLPRGTRFQLQFELLLKGNETDLPVMGNFLWLIQQLEKGEISLGSRTRRGFGRCKATNWSYMDLNLSNIEGVLKWLGLNRDMPTGWPAADFQPAEEHRKDYKISNMDADLKIPVANHKAVNRMQIDLVLKPSGSIQIGSGGHNAGEADNVHLHRINQNQNIQPEPIISGTTLGGILRKQSLKILNTISENTKQEDVKKFIYSLFGPEMSSKEVIPRASRVTTEETAMKEGTYKLLRHTRTAIDELAGGALNNMLIQEDPVFGGEINLKWNVIKPSDAETGLCLLLVKDLFTGELPIGGESSIGRGVLYGISGSIKIPEEQGVLEISIQGDGKGSLAITQGDPSLYLNKLQQDFAVEDIAHA